MSLRNIMHMNDVQDLKLDKMISNLITGSVSFQPRLCSISAPALSGIEPVFNWNKYFTNLTIQNSVDCPCCTSRDDQILGHILGIYVWAHRHDICNHTLRYKLVRRTNRRISTISIQLSVHRVHLGLRAFFEKPHSVLRAYTTVKRRLLGASLSSASLRRGRFHCYIIPLCKVGAGAE